MHPLYRAMFGPLEGLTDLAAPSGGDQAIDWTHVRDTAQGIVKLLRAPADLAGEAVNISSGVAVPHREIVDKVAGLMGRNSQVALGPGAFFDRGAPLSIAKARTRLGFAPRFTEIREGLRDYHAWLEAARK